MTLASHDACVDPAQVSMHVHVCQCECLWTQECPHVLKPAQVCAACCNQQACRHRQRNLYLQALQTPTLPLEMGSYTMQFHP